MRKKRLGPGRMTELMAVAIGQACAFIIVISRRAFGGADQHALAGQDQVDPGLLRGRIRFDCGEAFALRVSDNPGNGLGMIDNIMWHIRYQIGGLARLDDERIRKAVLIQPVQRFHAVGPGF